MSSLRSEFRVVVCGGRTFTDHDHVIKWLMRLFEPNYDNTDYRKDEGIPDAHKRWYLPRPDLVLIHGGATGVDSIAEAWANDNYVSVICFPADWEKYGSPAGPIRNRQMLREGKPHLVVAFKGGKGTADMVRAAKERNTPVLEIPYPDNEVNSEPAS